MADYYPLLAKAVAAQAQSDPARRRAIYERARTALLGQLRAIQPPIPEPDVERESQALDDAVNRLESELAQGSPPPAPAFPDPGGSPPLGEPARARLPLRPLPPRPLPPRPPLRSRPDNRPPAPTGPGDEASPSGAADEPARPPLAPVDGPLPGADSWDAPTAPPGSGTAGFSLPQNRAEPEPPLRPRSDQFHPAAPRPQAAGRRTRGIWIAGTVAALVVLLVAAAAWKLRDRPEELTRAKPAAPQSEAGNAKLSERVGGANQPASGTKSATGTPAAPGDQTIAVAHRAALLIEAPEEESKVKTYIGSVVWRLENVSRDSGQPLSNAVRADVDIPDAKLKVLLTFQKNLDAALPASHTISIRFTPLAGSPLGDVQQIDSPQMRRDEAPSGDPLSAVPVPIMDNNFLVGLARGDFETRNIDLIKTRTWIDVPMLLKSKRVAKLTLEKGVTGERAINDALAAWAGQ
ncbi:MAG: hypothetical protein QOH65_2302 [Methylobacteriaceae bacterium]|jgi:hypothetical protein|nr:hypothetical protein [Methylobacteriaceae bacterium]